MIEEWIKSDQENKFNSAFLCFYFLFEIMPTYMVVIAFRSPSSEPVAYTLTIKGGVNGSGASNGSGANSNSSSAPGTPRAALRYGSVGAGGMVAPALAPGAQYYHPSPHHGYLGDALLADPTVTLITPPASNPTSPSPHTPLLAPAAGGGRAAPSSSANGRWNEVAVKSAGGVNRVADDEVETLDLSQYQ